MDFFSKLKRSLFPTKYALRRIEQHLVRRFEQEVVQLRAIAFPKDICLNSHLDAIRRDNSDLYRDFEISYSLKLASRLSKINVTHRSPETCICTLAVGQEYRRTVSKCIKSVRTYAETKGFSYAELGEIPPHEQRPISWYKIPLLFRLADTYSHVVYVDADCLITNNNFALEDILSQLIQADKDVLLAEDEGGINAGVIIVRSTSNLYRLLDIIWNYEIDIEHPLWEQHALKSALTSFPLLQKLILLASNPRAFNALPYERGAIYPSTSIASLWEPGDWLVHFSGIRPPHLQTLIDRYAKLVK